MFFSNSYSNQNPKIKNNFFNDKLAFSKFAIYFFTTQNKTLTRIPYKSTIKVTLIITILIITTENFFYFQASQPNLRKHYIRCFFQKSRLLEFNQPKIRIFKNFQILKAPDFSKKNEVLRYQITWKNYQYKNLTSNFCILYSYYLLLLIFFCYVI